MGDDEQRWHEALDRLAESSERFERTVGSLSEEQLREPSLLPGWTRGHVVAHVARNADALANLVEWARTGVEHPAYASPEAREADIENGSGRPSAELLGDLRDATARLAEALASMTPEQREHQVALRDGTLFAAHGLPSVRLREVEIHHVDLDGGYGPADWPDSFVTRTLKSLAPTFAARGDVPVHLLAADDGGSWTVGPAEGPTLRGSRRDLLVWLIGRTLPVDLRSSHDAVPPSPQW